MKYERRRFNFHGVFMQRLIFINKVRSAFEVHRIVALLGPRQCGKTTIANEYAKNIPASNYFDLERPRDLARLENPELALEGLTGLIVIDEIQRRPDLFPVLRYLHDYKQNQQYLVLGSASRSLISQSSESLAGRIGYLELTPFNILEVQDIDLLWKRGGFPRSFLATSNSSSKKWIEQYIRTYLEQDIPQLGIKIPANQLHRFWVMLAHYHGNIVNYSSLGQSLDLTHVTLKKYADILLATFMIRILQPWHENISKRQVKAPKIYIRDSGIVQNLLGVEETSLHPKLGALFEGFALEQILNTLGTNDAYFWATHNGAELDLFIPSLNGKRIGFEIKYTDSPKINASMKVAIEDLKLDKLYCIIPGSSQFKLSEKVEVAGLEKVKDVFRSAFMLERSS